MAQGDFVDTDLLEDESKNISKIESHTSNLRTKFTSKEEEARRKLEEIRHQMDDLERQRLENAELTRRLEELDRSKSETHHQLARTVASLEKNELEISRQLATISTVRKELQEQLTRLEDIREESWTSENVRQNLQDAFETIEEARLELGQGRQQLALLEKVEVEPALTEEPTYQGDGFGAGSFGREILRGLAWTLPLILTAAILTLIAFFKR